jgi:hypothetical protein
MGSEKWRYQVPLLVILALSGTDASEGDNDGIFTSNTDLQNLLWTEHELVRGLKEYIEAEEAKIQRLKS